MGDSIPAYGLLYILRAECKAAGTQKAWAQAHDISPQYVADVLNGRREPSERIARALGWQRVVLFERIKK